MTAQQQALAALLTFGRAARLEDRVYSASHQLGDSPHDAGYQVRVTLAVIYEPTSRQYTATLFTGELRYQGGLVSARHEREMPVRSLGTWPATRFSAKRIEQHYTETLAALRKDPQPLIDLLQEESERS